MKLTWHDEKRAIKDLVPYVANPRQITEKQAKDLKASLDKFGLADPIIINTDNTIIGGHQRKKILETLMNVAPDFEIDVRVPDRELSIDEARELNVRLNKNVAEWDVDVLANNFELDDLLDWGFDKGELDLDLWADDAPEDVEPQIDKAEELRVKWGVESGQLWQLGEHRLVCGDCTDKAVVDKVMQGEVAGAVVTDPPYGMNLDTDYSTITGGEGKSVKHQKIIGDDEPYDPSALFSAFGHCKEIFLFGADYYLPRIPDWDKGTWLIWDKRVEDKYDSVIGSAYEVLWSKSKRRKAILRYQYVNWGARMKDGPKLHPTMKPVDLIEQVISMTDDDTVIDPFLGSGTTLIACERLGRKCRAIEISPAYVAVAIQRWVDMTGGEPVLVSN